MFQHRRFYGTKIMNAVNNSSYKMDKELLSQMAMGNGRFPEQVNSLRTLPRIDLIKSRDEIKKELLQTREPKSYDGILITYKQTKNMLLFFKEGLFNIWRVNMELRKTVFNGKRYLIDYNRSGDVNGRLILRYGSSNYRLLIDKLAERVSLTLLEVKNGKRPIDSIVTGNEQDEVLLTRKEFIEIVRDDHNFTKLPLFGLIFFIFAECSLPIFYIFPQLLPSTCILPGKLEGRYYDKHHGGLSTLTEIHAEEDRMREYLQAVAMNVMKAHSVPTKDLPFVCHSLLCKGTTLESLQLHQKEILVDDYLILASAGGPSSLSDAELVHGCRVRGLATIDAENNAVLRKRVADWLEERMKKE